MACLFSASSYGTCSRGLRPSRDGVRRCSASCFARPARITTLGIRFSTFRFSLTSASDRHTAKPLIFKSTPSHSTAGAGSATHSRHVYGESPNASCRTHPAGPTLQGGSGIRRHCCVGRHRLLQTPCQIREVSTCLHAARQQCPPQPCLSDQRHSAKVKAPASKCAADASCFSRLETTSLHLAVPFSSIKVTQNNATLQCR